MNEIFKIFGIIAIENSEANRGINETTDKAKDSSSKISNFFSKIGKAAVSAGKVVAKGLGAGAAAIGTLVVAATKSYAEYEQLVGGIETLFKDSAKKVQQYANEAYRTAGMSANEYMSTVTSFSSSLLQSMARTSSSISEEAVEAQISALEKQYDALEEANEKQEELMEEAHENEIEAYEELTEQKIDLINKQYRENLKLIDEEKYNKIKAIEAQIDALNGQTEAEREAIEKREQEQKKASLMQEVLTAETVEERIKAQQELDEYIADLEQKEREKQRKAQIDALKAEKEAVKEEADLKKEAAKEQYDAEISAVKKQSEDELKILKKAQKEELEALKKANKEKLDETEAYINKRAEMLESMLDSSSSTAVYTAEVYEKAADKANMAIIDMSDNANKMGTDLAMIQNAYQGFAKQNYTMLDNLRLGYGGTKSEMERLLADAQAISGVKYDVSSYADIVDAIHVIQTEMGISGLTAEEAAEMVEKGLMTEAEAFEAMGTTAKEATKTISGSLSALKASWSNLLTGIADEEQDTSVLIGRLVDSAKIAADNLMPVITESLSGMGEVVGMLVPIIAAELPGLVEKILPDLIVAATSLIVGLVTALPSIVKILIDQAPVIISQIATALKGAAPALLSAVVELFDQIKKSLGQFIEYIAEELFGVQVDTEAAFSSIGDMFGKLWELYRKFWNDIGKPVWDAIMDVIGAVVVWIFDHMDEITDCFETGFEIISGIIDVFTAFFRGDWEGMWEAVKKTTKKAQEFVQKRFDLIFTFLKDIGSKIWEVVSGAFQNVADSISEKMWEAHDGIIGIFQKINDAIMDKIDKLKDIVKKGVDKVKEFFDFDWKLPELKMPHFTMKGEFSINPPSIPEFGVEWYKNGAVLNEPTAFGINPGTGKVMVGGEAGAEAVAPIDTLKQYIAEAVAAQNAGMVEVFDEWMGKLMEFLMQYIPALANMNIVMDSGELVGKLAPAMDRQLGSITKWKARGN